MIKTSSRLLAFGFADLTACVAVKDIDIASGSAQQTEFYEYDKIQSNIRLRLSAKGTNANEFIIQSNK